MNTKPPRRLCCSLHLHQRPPSLRISPVSHGLCQSATAVPPPPGHPTPRTSPQSSFASNTTVLGDLLDLPRSGVQIFRRCPRSGVSPGKEHEKFNPPKSLAYVLHWIWSFISESPSFASGVPNLGLDALVLDDQGAGLELDAESGSVGKLRARSLGTVAYLLVRVARHFLHTESASSEFRDCHGIAGARSLGTDRFGQRLGHETTH
ncbi:hypothetical protein FH972_005408 [Carpinus fangiana]|uniref:Uncharacterized protein n=1 Tax=Carpinus fangiana TaxID=176857 RepID=A0A5N6QRM0_9ROSI|nr:hypothetical protein FH972_005408 [Carpinus fangiana]